MNPEKILKRARNAIGKFCIEECKSYCCRKGYLIINPEKVDKVCQKRTKELGEKNILKKLKSGDYSLDLGNTEMSCPSLDKENFKCKIHKSKKRPEACELFPIFMHGNEIKISPRCLAVKQNLFYPYIARLKKLGYKISETNPYADYEVNRMVIFEKVFKEEVDKTD